MYQILFVDDEALVRAAIAGQMPWEECGFTLVGTCRNGKEAVSFLETHTVHAVLTDINMPYMDGLELAKHISSLYPSVRVMILSGYQEFEYAKKAILYRVSEYILKPVTANELSEVLKRVYKEIEEEEIVKNSKKQLQGAYVRNLPIIRSRFLWELAADQVLLSEEEIVLRLRELNILLEGEVYLAVTASGNKPSEDRTFICFVIHNILSELAEKRDWVVSFTDPDGNTVLFFAGSCEEDLRGVAEEMYQLCRKELEPFEIGISFGLGCAADGYRALSDSFKESRQALKQRVQYGRDGIFSLSDCNGAGSAGAFKVAAKAMEYLKEQYADSELTLQTLCRELGISASHFSAVFKEFSGATFSEALNRIRMERAKELLTQTDLKNYEVAEQVGFMDSHYFAAAFKKYTGMTPKEYARKGGQIQ